MNKNFNSHLLLLFTTLIAAFNYSISKILIPVYLHPSTGILVRVMITALVFVTAYLFSKKERVRKEDIARLVLSAALGIAANQLLFFEGLSRTTPINASLMMTSAPIVIVLFSSFILREKITRKKIIGTVLAAFGAISLLLHSGTQPDGNIFLGDLMVLSNACCWALFLVTVKPLMAKYSTITIVTWLFVIGSLFVLPFGYKGLIDINLNIFTWQAWAALSFIVVFATVIAYYFNVKVLKNVDASVAGIYIYLQPVLATLIAMGMGKDVLTLEKSTFALLILSGVYLVSSNDKISKERP